MSREHVSHKEILNFAESKVNLPKEWANEYREQVGRLRDKLTTYISENPSFALKKMLLSGSLAKGTALRSLNDIDVACYISGADAPTDIKELMNYLVEKLRKAFPNFSPEQVQPKTYCVTVSFKGSGLDVDVVPIIYYGDPNWYGNLVSQDDGSFLKTCIPRHLEFFRKRKSKQEKHFAQVVRLAKFWVKKMKNENSNFRFKSFMVELIFAKLIDEGNDFSDYIEGMQHFFTYLAKTDLSELIVFDDYYPTSDVKVSNDIVNIFDPVNSENNAARLYSSLEASLISEAAIEAGDSIDSALASITKEKTVYYWQKVFGSTFQA